MPFRDLRVHTETLSNASLRLVPNRYYSISEVSALTGIPAVSLRYMGTMSAKLDACRRVGPTRRRYRCEQLLLISAVWTMVQNLHLTYTAAISLLAGHCPTGFLERTDYRLGVDEVERFAREALRLRSEQRLFR